MNSCLHSLVDTPAQTARRQRRTRDVAHQPLEPLAVVPARNPHGRIHRPAVAVLPLAHVAGGMKDRLLVIIRIGAEHTVGHQHVEVHVAVERPGARGRFNFQLTSGHT